MTRHGRLRQQEVGPARQVGGGQHVAGADRRDPHHLGLQVTGPSPGEGRPQGDLDEPAQALVVGPRGHLDLP
jgi:hypothetical protein